MFFGIKRRLALVLVLSASLLLPAASAAQSTSDWSSLNAVRPGSKLYVRLRNGTTVEGKLSGVSDAALALSVKNSPTELRREDVLTVHQSRRKSAATMTLIGAGVGAGVGAVAGAATASDESDFIFSEGQSAAILAAIGAGVGALTGYLVGRTRRKRVLVYGARP